MNRSLNIIITLVALAGATAGGWAVANRVQTVVPIVPGVDGCGRLETATKQIECLATEFADGADRAAEGLSGTKRDKAVIAYVRRAETLAASDQKLADTCHSSMHRLGRREGSRAAGEDRAPTFPGGSSQMCTAGYAHGLSEGYIRSSTSIDVETLVPELCSDLESRAGCVHGVGHALIQARDSISEENQERALTECERVPEVFVSDCHNGIYMELAMRTSAPRFEPAMYTQACTRTTTVERELACWAYLPLNLSLHDVPLSKYPSWCSRADLPGQFSCIEGYGRQLGVDKVNSCSASAKRPELRQRCVEGAIGLQVGSGHVSSADARSACRTIDDRALRRHCASAVTRYSKGRAKVEAESSL